MQIKQMWSLELAEVRLCATRVKALELSALRTTRTHAAAASALKHAKAEVAASLLQLGSAAALQDSKEKKLPDFTEGCNTRKKVGGKCARAGCHAPSCVRHSAVTVRSQEVEEKFRLRNGKPADYKLTPEEFRAQDVEMDTILVGTTRPQHGPDGYLPVLECDLSKHKKQLDEANRALLAAREKADAAANTLAAVRERVCRSL
jgi:hypothetical protein